MARLCEMYFVDSFSSSFGGGSIISPEIPVALTIWILSCNTWPMLASPIYLLMDCPMGPNLLTIFINCATLDPCSASNGILFRV